MHLEVHLRRHRLRNPFATTLALAAAQTTSPFSFLAASPVEPSLSVSPGSSSDAWVPHTDEQRHVMALLKEQQLLQLEHDSARTKFYMGTSLCGNNTTSSSSVFETQRPWDGHDYPTLPSAFQVPADCEVPFACDAEVTVQTNTQFVKF
eukprot:GHVT01020895.1.p3 GENE.GHVT01020895.1~~GHVT01020895.1.p3  ORF type:complete len:149 (-),score=21.96 GHVT01020895.1:942-1388(-)